MIIQNNQLKLEITENGGEMSSLILKDKQLEVLWQGDEAHWKGKNPTLFPMVGNTYTKDYEWQGKKYAMKNHGLVRYAVLECVEHTESKIVMQLKANADTLAQYPFDFTYQIQYELIENSVVITYRITNNGEEDMPFTFGLHPAFNVSDYAKAKLVYSSTQHMTQLRLPDLQENAVSIKEWPLSHEQIEATQTIVYKDFQAAYVDLVQPDYTLRMSTLGYPYLALWTSDPTANFICIEPWYGRGDQEPNDYAFDKRPGMMSLASHRDFVTSTSISLF